MCRERIERIIFVLTLITAVGIIWQLFIPVMPKGLTPDEETFARHALRLGWHALEDPVSRGLGRRFIVRDIVRTANNGTCGDLPYIAQGQFQATVIAKGLFGVTVARAKVDCDSARRLH